jgi:predicted DNA repair protein MutK
VGVGAGGAWVGVGSMVAVGGGVLVAGVSLLQAIIKIAADNTNRTRVLVFKATSSWVHKGGLSHFKCSISGSDRHFNTNAPNRAWGG